LLSRFAAPLALIGAAIAGWVTHRAGTPGPIGLTPSLSGLVILTWEDVWRSFAKALLFRSYL